jgi:hypothetical protein
MYRPRISLALGFFLTVAAFTGLTGCQSGGLGNLGSSDTAMEQLTPVVREAAKTYISSLSTLTSRVKYVHDLHDAIGFSEKARPLLDQISNSHEILSLTTGEDRVNLVKAYGDRINSVNSDFLNERNATAEESKLGMSLSPLLDSVPLFRP